MKRYEYSKKKNLILFSIVILFSIYLVNATIYYKFPSEKNFTEIIVYPTGAKFNTTNFTIIPSSGEVNVTIINVTETHSFFNITGENQLVNMIFQNRTSTDFLWDLTNHNITKKTDLDTSNSTVVATSTPRMFVLLSGQFNLTEGSKTKLYDTSNNLIDDEVPITIKTATNSSILINSTYDFDEIDLRVNVTSVSNMTNVTWYYKGFDYAIAIAVETANVTYGNGLVFDLKGINISSTGDNELTYVNTTLWNVSEPVWKLYPLEDSYINSKYPTASFYDYTRLESGALLRNYNSWAWLKFDKSSVNYCDKAYLCMYRYHAYLLSDQDFKLYYSHNQTWTEGELTWNVKPEWNDAHVSNLTMTSGSSDDEYYCWDIADAYCDNVNDNATYMLRVKIETFDTGTEHANYTTESIGAKRSYDLYVDEANSTGNFNDSAVIELLNVTGASRWGYLEIAPSSIYFPGSRVNNATLYMYVPGGCNQSLNVSVYRTYEENTTDTMTWDSKPKIDTSDLGKIDEINMTTTGWKTLNITDMVQRSALSGGWFTSNISLRFAPTTEGGDTTTILDGGETTKRFNFTTNGNKTDYIKIPKYVNVTSAYINLTGKTTWIDTKWNNTLPDPTVHHVVISPGGDGDYTCTDTHAGIGDFTHASSTPYANANFAWNVSSWNTAWFNWTAVYGYANVEGSGVGGGDESYYIRGGDTCTETLADICAEREDGDNAIPECTEWTENSTSPPGDFAKKSIFKVTAPTKGDVIALGAFAGSTAGLNLKVGIKWEGDSYLKITMENRTCDFPENVSIDFNNDGDYDWINSGNLTTTNRTIDFASDINTFLTTCSPDANGLCSFPIVIHADVNGTVILDDIEINYTGSCFASCEYDSYDPIVEIGFTYTTKDAYAYFNSSNTSGTAYDPYLVANISWGLNATSNNGTFEPFGQTDTQWIHKVCSDPESNGPIDIYLNLTDIVNSTGDSLTELPACVTSFYHYGNSTNVDSACEENITGNTAVKVLDGLKNGTCAYIWENLTFSDCTVGDAFSFNFSWSATTESFGG